MHLAKTDGMYPIIDPVTNTIMGTKSAKHVLDMITEGAHRNGEPGVVFLDTINKDNKVSKQFGDIIATNPCGEQPLLGYESCNLGSINLANFYDEECNGVYWGGLKQTIFLAIRFLKKLLHMNNMLLVNLHSNKLVL